MRKYYLFMVLSLLSQVPLFSQRKAFEQLNALESLPVNQEETRIYEYFKNDVTVEDVKFIRINFKALRDGEMRMDYKGQTSQIKRKSEQSHGNSDDYSWFGTMPDQTGIFFTVINQQVAAKFYMGDDPCAIVPYRGDIHLLVTYKPGSIKGACGVKGIPRKESFKILVDEKFSTSQLQGADDNCTLRVLWVVTTEAETDIPMNLELAARMLQDEANLAYEQSEITTRLEIARVVRANFEEHPLSGYEINVYGKDVTIPIDLENLVTGTGAFANALMLRELYKADIVVLALHKSNMGISYGFSYGVPDDPYPLNPAYGFMAHSTRSLISQRFVFSHEIAHIHGARHDDVSGNPVYARGHKFSSASTNNQTIMRTEDDGNDRVQFFSNPNVTYNGVPVGTSDRNNARRINETAAQVLNFRVTSNNLALPNETFEDEILARHLANQTISTDNKTVIAQAGSRVSMRAGTSVTLLPGFHAQQGSEFAAYTNTCSYVPTARMASPVNPSSSVEDDIEVEEFEYEAYPNPTSGIFVVTHPETSKLLMVYDNLGRLILHIRVEKESTVIDLSNFPSGMYTINIDTKSIRVLKK